MRRPGVASPTHAGTGLPFDDRQPSRSQAWGSLGPRLRTRVSALAGELVEWFAATDHAAGDGRARCVVLGLAALVIAEPRIDTSGREVYAVSHYDLDPVSHRSLPVVHRPPRGGGRRDPAAVPSADRLGLGAAELGQLGNLPPAAQQLLQAPFSAAEPVTRCEYYYIGYPNRLETYLYVLAGRRHLTAAVGTQQVPVGHTVADARWSLVCHRADVVAVTGS